MINKKQFLSLKTADDVANLFGTNYENLSNLIYKLPFKYRYTEFKILKKSGEHRTIHKPNKKLKEIQKDLSDTLLLIYKPRSSVHGFCRERNVVTNAAKHLSKSFILNIDLKDFFNSIHFGRVKNLFKAMPLQFNENVAVILAHICCYNNMLPQGAPTSPILTNMICFKMDKQFQKLASDCNCTYSRYADDITFSFTCNKRRISKKILDDFDTLVLGSSLVQIIQSNGFVVNQSKVRLYSKTRRKLVTGIKVNELLNVQRKYINQIRSMLHAWEKFSYENAKNTFEQLYLTPRHKAFATNPEYKNVIRGKLNYLKMVRGKRDSIYIKYAKWFNEVNQGFNEKPLTYIEETDEEKQLIQSILVVEIMYDDDEGNAMISFGTGFYVSKTGIITCAHVVSDSKHIIYKKIIVYTWDKCNTPYECRVIKIDQDYDIAILEPLNSSLYDAITSFCINTSGKISLQQEVKLLGFPAYSTGQSPHIVDSKISSIFPEKGIKRFEIAAQIREGNSGGPVLNTSNEVIGIAREGAEKGMGKNAVTRIEELAKLK